MTQYCLVEEEEEEDIIKLTQRGLDVKFSRPQSHSQLTDSRNVNSWPLVISALQ